MATPKRRVPQTSSNSKAAIGEDVKRPTEFFCCRCGKYFSRQAANFPTSKSALYRGNNGYLTICKNCLNELYQFYLEKLGSPQEAGIRVCSQFDIYYAEDLFDNIVGTAAPNVAVTTYIGRLANTEHKMKSFDDYLDENAAEKTRPEELNEDQSEVQAQIIANGRIRWGLDLSADDYEYLDKEFEDWNNRCNVDSKARESMVREICVLKLLQNKAIVSGDIETYNKLSATLQKTLTTAELTPRQVQEQERNSEIPLGVLIKRIEDEEPIPEALPEFRDVDGIQRYIRVYFIGHLMKMLGLKNRFSEEYESELGKYLPKISDEIESDDSEDIYDYLVKNGFSEQEDDEVSDDTEGEGS